MVTDCLKGTWQGCGQSRDGPLSTVDTSLAGKKGEGSGGEESSQWRVLLPLCQWYCCLQFCTVSVLYCTVLPVYCTTVFCTTGPHRTQHRVRCTAGSAANGSSAVGGVGRKFQLVTVYYTLYRNPAHQERGTDRTVQSTGVNCRG